MNDIPDFQSEPLHSTLDTMTFGEMLKWLIDGGVRPRGDPKQGIKWRDGDLAEVIGVSPRTLNNWLRDQSPPKFSNGVCRAFAGPKATDNTPLRIALHRGLRRTQKIWNQSRLAVNLRSKKMQKLAAVRTPHIDEFAALKHFKSADEVGEFLADLPFTFDVTEKIEKTLKDSRNQSTLLGHLETLCRSGGQSPVEIRATTLIANIFSKIDYWQPDQAVIGELQNRCTSLISKEDDSRIMYIEALAFGLSKVGSPAALKHSITKFHYDQEWANADFKRLADYYGHIDLISSAMVRHHRDVRRTGLRVANNTHRLLRLAAIRPLELHYETDLLPIILKSAAALLENGMTEVGRDVVHQLKSARRSR